MITFASGFTAQEIPDEIKRKIIGISYHQNNRVQLSDLMYLRVKHINFQDKECIGELICNKKVAKELLEIFYELYQGRYPVEKIRLVDEYEADDEKSMSNNNSSCFNYRVIADTDVISMHGIGLAVDINPLYNPYVVGDKVMPAIAFPYADRTKDFAYKIDENDFCYKVFSNKGWLWGGKWKNSKDYQHFYKPEKSIHSVIMKIRKAICL